MFSVHAIHLLLRNILIFFILIAVALFFWLKSGIQTDSFVLGQYKVEGLYLKLGKKLTLVADNVVIPKNKSKPSFENVDKTFDTIRYLFTFFDYIELKHIVFENNHLHIIFTDDVLYLTSDDYEIAGNIHRIDKTLRADVSLLYLKKQNITIKGNLRYDLSNSTLSTEGKFDANSVQGHFTAQKQGDEIRFGLSSREFTDLRPVVEAFQLQEGIKEWIVDRVKAQKYQLRRLEGEGRITDSGFKIDFDTLKAEMLLDGVKIYYHKSLDPVLAKELKVTYAHRRVDFDMKEPLYKKRTLEGSRVAIEGLGEDKTLLRLDLHMHTPVDNVLKQVLKSYNINIPVKYKGAPADVVFKMDIPLGKYAQKKRNSVWVKVDLKRGNVWYKKVKLPIRKGKVIFDNSKKESIRVWATLKKGKIDIGETKIPVVDGKGEYKKGMVTLEGVHLKDGWYEGMLDGKIDLKKKKADLVFDAKKITLGEKKRFFLLKNKKLPISLDYNKDLQIDIPALALKITGGSKNMHIAVKKIEKIKPYLRDIDLEIDGGNIDVVKDGESYTFTGELHRKSCFLYEKNAQCYTKIPVSGKVTKAGLVFYAFGKRLYYNAGKSRITLKNLNIDLQKFLDTRKQREKNGIKHGKLVIVGRNSKLRYKKYTLVTDSYDIEISPKNEIKASGSLGGDIVQFSKKGKEFSLKALRIKDTMLHPLIGFKGLKHGRYTLINSGNPDSVIKGEIIVEGGIMSDFKAYNNTLALLNAIPALATLNSPGFSEKGFKIEQGLVEYRMIADRVIFDSVYIKGRAATIVGKGELNLKRKTINMEMGIQVARELGNVLGSIPLVGYILVGKDKSVTVGLQITGSLDKPKVSVSAAKDILSYPLEIIKRTIEAPGELLLPKHPTKNK